MQSYKCPGSTLTNALDLMPTSASPQSSFNINFRLKAEIFKEIQWTPETSAQSSPSLSTRHCTVGVISGEVRSFLCVHEVFRPNPGLNARVTGGLLRSSMGVIAGATEFVPWNSNRDVVFCRDTALLRATEYVWGTLKYSNVDPLNFNL